MWIKEMKRYTMNRKNSKRLYRAAENDEAWKMMKNTNKCLITIVICLIAFLCSASIGSVIIPGTDILKIIWHKITGAGLGDIPDTTVSILMNIRLPRALLSFLVGSALAVSGTVMQSVLRNPLASSYTIGVSSGASLGAAIAITSGLTLAGASVLAVPLIAFLSGLLTVFLVIGFTKHFDRNLENQTIILVGMVFSLFVNAILTLVTALSQDHLQQLIYWQMGSFSSKGYIHVLITAFVLLLGIPALIHYSPELDILTFGEEQAKASGVNVERMKYLLITISTLLTGISVAFCGTIGFVDLIAPHIVRRIFGSSHKLVIPMSALFGGAIMAFSDLISRTVLAPRQLPVGAITALIGAPFFAYIYFAKRKEKV